MEYGCSSETYKGFTRSDFAFVCVTLYSFFKFGEGSSSSRCPMRPAYHYIKSGGASTGLYGIGAAGPRADAAGYDEEADREGEGENGDGKVGDARWYEDIVDWPVRSWTSSASDE